MVCFDRADVDDNDERVITTAVDITTCAIRRLDAD